MIAGTGTGNENARARKQLGSGLPDWPLGGQITRIWLFFFLLGLEK